MFNKPSYAVQSLCTSIALYELIRYSITTATILCFFFYKKVLLEGPICLNN